ncbi:MAG: aminotransferase class I/II-fold pyridoxal phosphate-dependent enzyme, partial [Candidatus Lambdaproteobacteria bacterium]|nr:aminotransferase class I/II-fold pyridoxal phosphate-dependent enzyme [Candidatus Lambdaproteobacteria bacterium]
QMLMLMLLEPGDEVIVSDPTYACYENFVRIAHGRPVRVPIVEAEGFQLDPAKVRTAITPRTRAVMVCSPANPTGVVMRPELMAQIAALGVPVISDEIYHGLSYGGRDHTMLEFTDNAFILNGFSKYFAMTGWRLGYLISPLETMPAVMKLHQNIMISATDFSQVAARVAMAEAVPICETYRAEYDRRRVYLMERLAAMGLPLGYEPTGAFYAFVNVSRYTSDSIGFAMQLLNETGVAMTPGADFGPGGEGYLRISYANSLENIAKGMDQLQAFLQTLRR